MNQPAQELHLKNRSSAPKVLRVRPLSAAIAPAYKEPPNACTDAFSNRSALPTSHSRGFAGCAPDHACVGGGGGGVVVVVGGGGRGRAAWDYGCSSRLDGRAAELAAT